MPYEALPNMDIMFFAGSSTFFQFGFYNSSTLIVSYSDGSGVMKVNIPYGAPAVFFLKSSYGNLLEQLVFSVAPFSDRQILCPV